MTAKQWHNGDIEALGVHYQPLTIEGRTVGGLVSLGRAVVFYAEDPRASEFDGQRFADAGEARRTIARRLARPEPAAPGAVGSN